MISIFVPSLNEAKNIRSTVDSIREAQGRAGGLPLEVIIVNDGSTDETGSVAEEIAKQVSFVRVIHNEQNLGLGRSLIKALAIAKYEKFLIVPGDNDISQDLLVAFFSSAGKADLIMSYFLNREIRGRRRNVISNIFASIYMITFGVFVQYINGPCVYPTARLREINLKANRFSIVVEATLKLLCSGCTYYEVAGYMQKGLAGSTSLSTKNLVEVVKSYIRLIFEIKVLNHSQFNKSPRRVY